MLKSEQLSKQEAEPHGGLSDWGRRPFDLPIYEFHRSFGTACFDGFTRAITWDINGVQIHDEE